MMLAALLYVLFIAGIPFLLMYLFLAWQKRQNKRAVKWFKMNLFGLSCSAAVILLWFATGKGEVTLSIVSVMICLIMFGMSISRGIIHKMPFFEKEREHP